MKKKELEIVLQKLPPHPAPIIKLEQYATPANIAADIMFNAYLEEDIADKVVLDLGCGTGIFSIGAKLLGAQEVIGVDIDGTGLAIGEGYADALSLEISFIEHDLKNLDILKITSSNIDTIIQNPPFGAQKASLGADRLFLKKALAWGKIVYSMHLSKTEAFIERFIEKLDAELLWKKKYKFPISHMFFFHTKESVEYEVTLFKIKS
jgi:putative methylase